jgi:DNA mismatch endonuclease (patch repair protein)
VDCFTSKMRSKIMRAVKGRNTKPELIVHQILDSLGFRYRLHIDSLPGCPDIVFTKRKKVIFVHGCFWHRHTCKRGRKIPASRGEYWKPKLERNRKRDLAIRKKLRALGWQYFIVWECQIPPKNLANLTKRIAEFLKKPA